MKAVLIRKFGAPDVMNVEEAERPVVQDDEILVRIRYSSINPVDWKVRNGSLKMLTGSRFPMFLGFDIAGEIVETGKEVAGFKKGARVFGMLDYRRRGAYAEYVSAKENNIALMPQNLDFRDAAAIPLAGLTAYQALHNKGKIKSGDNVLVNGASGGVGLFAVQIAKASGAEVTGVCSTDNVEVVKNIGADKVIDYKKEDITQIADRYDIIFDAVGKLSFFKIRKILKNSGCYVTTLPNTDNILAFITSPVLSIFGYRKRASMINVRPNHQNLEVLSSLAEQKKLIPLIDRVFKLEDIREAHKYSETGRARGKIVIEIS